MEASLISHWRDYWLISAPLDSGLLPQRPNLPKSQQVSLYCVIHGIFDVNILVYKNVIMEAIILYK